MHKRQRISAIIIRFLFLLLGSFITAVGLEIFLIPNNIIDGGVVGISIIAAYLSKLPLGIFIFALNLPFLFFGYKQIGKTFVISSLFSITMLSVFVTLLHPFDVLTDDVLLAAVFGGIILGIGVGMIIRNGGSLDGTEIIAIAVNKNTVFSVGQTVMFFNLFILSSAAFVFGWDRAMYSLIAYFIAYKLIDTMIDGLDEAKSAIIISDQYEDIAQTIMDRLGRGVTMVEGAGGFSNHKKTILYVVVTRLEVSKLKSIIHEKDENAFVTIQDIFDVMGGKHKKKAIH